MSLDALIACPAGPDLFPPPRSLAIHRDELEAWLEDARPGARIEYHRGHLVVDRARGLTPFGEGLRRELDAVAGRALALAEEGRLLLVQRRHGHGDCSYLAIKARRRPARAAASSGPRNRGGR